uniref:Uncharacterized protein n=1 Tax=viral metagenome TaxID=1070528 RepID=A0A6M3KIK9_9ZZZZ
MKNKFMKIINFLKNTSCEFKILIFVLFFYIICLLGMEIFIVDDDYKIFDFTTRSYIILTLFSMFGFFLFMWWWIKLKKASHVYMYITLLLFALSVRGMASYYVRKIRLEDLSHFTRSLESWWWPISLIPLVLGVMFLVTHMSYRVFVQRKKMWKSSNNVYRNKKLDGTYHDRKGDK